jgi:hypothetical protein
MVNVDGAFEGIRALQHIRLFIGLLPGARIEGPRIHEANALTLLEGQAQVPAFRRHPTKVKLIHRLPWVCKFLEPITHFQDTKGRDAVTFREFLASTAKQKEIDDLPLAGGICIEIKKRRAQAIAKGLRIAIRCHAKCVIEV